MKAVYQSLVILSIAFSQGIIQTAFAVDSNPLFLQLTPNKETYVVGEAILVQMTYSNKSNNALVINLGIEGVENIGISLHRDGEALHPTPPNSGGLRKTVTYTLPPHGKVRHSLLLSKLIRIGQPGLYTLEIKSEGTDAQTTIRVVPGSLTQICLSLQERMNNKSIPESERQMAMQCLSLTVGDEAVPYQQEIIRDANIDIEIRQQAIESIVSIHSRMAAEFLSKKVLAASGKDDAVLRATALWHLRASKDKWDKRVWESYFLPYEKEITNATDSRVGD